MRPRRRVARARPFHGQLPTDVGLRLARHRGTTANVASIYPFHGGTTPGSLGPFIGLNITSGGCGWFFDPFELYGRDVGGATVTNSNMLIVGEPGFGKSATAKTILWREAGYYGRRRFIAISDPKGEYGGLGRGLGLAAIRLAPGGHDRVNPLDAGPGDPALSLLNRQTLMVGLLSIVLRRDLTAIEEAVLTVGVEHLDDTLHGATLVDFAHLLGELPETLTSRRDLAFVQLADMSAASTHLRLGLGKLLERTLRGMFDGRTTVSIDWEAGQGLVLDLSAVFGNTDASAARADGGYRVAADGDGRSARTGTTGDPRRRRGLGGARDRTGRSTSAGTSQALSALRHLEPAYLSPALRPSVSVRRRHCDGEGRSRPSRRRANAGRVQAGT